MLISPAYAQAAGSSVGSGIEAFLPLILIFVVFYFLLIRPQQKKMKEHKNMLANIRRGDRVVTGGGIIGKVTKVVEDKDEVVVEIADGLKVDVVRSTISVVLDKTEPQGDSKSGDKKSSDKDDSTNDNASNDGKASGLKKLLGGKKD